VVVTPKPVEKQTNAWPSDDTPVALPPEQKRPAPKPIDIVVITPNPGPIAQTQAWPSDDGLGKTQPKTPAIRIDLVVVAPNPGVMTNAWPSDQEAGRTPGLHPQIIAEPTTAQRIIGS
jgi:hypothetical protein